MRGMAKIGVDVHGSKGPVDWRRVRGHGIDFAIVKATEGRTFRDKLFQSHRKAARDAGLLVGAYHFARPSLNSPAQEAANFLGALFEDGRRTQVSELVVLDFEDEKVGRGVKLGAWAREFLDRVEQRVGRVPMLYTFTSYWTAHGASTSTFARYPLWLADYDGGYTVPRPWTRLTLHQFTSSGTVPGIPGRVDMNRFDGDQAALADLFGATPPSAPPTTPGEDVDVIERIIVIPSMPTNDPDQHVQKVDHDKDGNLLGLWSKFEGVEVAAKHDGTEATRIRLEPFHYFDALCFVVTGLDGGPAPAGREARILVSQRT